MTYDQKWRLESLKENFKRKQKELAELEKEIERFEEMIKRHERLEQECKAL